MNENKICPIGTKVQSLIFSKEKFTENSAKEWAENHNYKFGYADEKEETFRIRQKNPKYFDNDSFRTIDITDGIQAVIACPKKKMEDGGEFVFITDRQVNDECVLELVELIRSEKSISSWFIDKIALNLVIVFDNEIMIDDVSKFEDILLKLDSCHDVFKPEITFEYNKETKVILIPLLTDDISVGEFEDGGDVKGKLQTKVTGSLFKGENWEYFVNQIPDYFLKTFNAPLGLENRSNVLSENFTNYYGEKDIEIFLLNYKKYPNATTFIKAGGYTTKLPKFASDYLYDILNKNNETLQGGAGDKLTIEDVANKHNVSVEYANEQLNKGIKIESEHTTDIEKQTEIALDHLSEFIEYYNELEKMEEKLKEKEAKKDSFEREGFQTGKGKLYEFFTPQEIADKMVALAQHYGFKGGRVLEPAAGNGRLLKNLSNADITAFEINIENYEFLKKQFPNADIYNFNFEKAFLKEPRYNSLIDAKATKTWLSGYPFDLVLANPPYGKFSGLYSSYFKFKGQVEHFFILQTLYLLKSGGIGVYLVPSSFLRNGITYNEIKKTIFGMAKLTDAYRLPVNIFKDTQIGTDIIVLTKK
jgi:type I restriction-modification system DNA methylase subunit